MKKTHQNKRDILESIIAPFEIRDFTDRYWGKKPLLIEGRDQEHYEGLIQEADIFDFLDNGNISPNSIRIIKNGNEVPKSEYSSAEVKKDGSQIVRIDNRLVIDQFQKGSTIVLESIDASIPSVKTVCRKLEVFFHAKIHGNIYLSPPDSSGFTTHYDTHDVFILQIMGVKQWKVFESAHGLPLKEHPCDLEKDLPGKMLFDTTIQKGDLIYLPRGAMHLPQTKNQSSMHLTIGVQGIYWYDILIESLLKEAKTNLHLQEQLPIGFLDDPDILGSDRIPERIRHFFPPHQYKDALTTCISRMLTQRKSQFHGLAKSFNDGLRIRPEDRFRINEDMIIFIDYDDLGTKIMSDAFTLRIPKRFEAVIRFLMKASTFTAGELKAQNQCSQSISQAEIMGLCTTLRKAGVLLMAEQFS